MYKHVNHLQVWYAGAYTVQTNVLPVDTGRQVNIPEGKCFIYVTFKSSYLYRKIGWANNATLGIAGPILVDGAKRDRYILSLRSPYLMNSVLP